LKDLKTPRRAYKKQYTRLFQFVKEVCPSSTFGTGVLLNHGQYIEEARAFQEIEENAPLYLNFSKEESRGILPPTATKSGQMKNETSL
jgi:hypothetical protein